MYIIFELCYCCVISYGRLSSGAGYLLLAYYSERLMRLLAVGFVALCFSFHLLPLSAAGLEGVKAAASIVVEVEMWLISDCRHGIQYLGSSVAS